MMIRMFRIIARFVRSLKRVERVSDHWLYENTNYWENRRYK
jgi:hypothetical protein